MGSATAIKIQDIIEPVLESLGFELVDVQLRTEPIGLVLRVIIYKDSGISVGDCSTVSRELGPLLEVEDVISKAYHLEVSSPGLDRPLTTERDFSRNIGKKITLTIKGDAEQKKKGVTGTIKSCASEILEVAVGDTVRTINLSEVFRAKLVIGF